MQMLASLLPGQEYWTAVRTSSHRVEPSGRRDLIVRSLSIISRMLSGQRQKRNEKLNSQIGRKINKIKLAKKKETSAQGNLRLDRASEERDRSEHY